MKYSQADKLLCDVLEWAKGMRGSKSGSPYGVPEIKAALVYLASKQGKKDWLDADTTKGM
jgi:hypothetical protein